MIVADAPPLIHLARAGLADLLPKLYERVVVPTSVWEEASGHAGEPRPEATVLQEASVSWLEARTLPARARRAAGSFVRGAPIGRAEADAIALAEALRAAVLMDDRVAVDLARMRGVETRWTTSVVLEAHRLGVLDRTAARRAIEDLVATGLWIRQDILLRILAVLADRRPDRLP
jgi:predicted nucleic acid-binding protein